MIRKIARHPSLSAPTAGAGLAATAQVRARSGASGSGDPDDAASFGCAAP